MISYNFIHGKMWKWKCHYYFEAVTVEIFSKKEDLYFAFVELQKGFDRVSRDVLVLEETRRIRVIF